MLELFQKVIYDVTGKKGVTLDTDFVQDLHLTSLDVMNIIGVFETRFQTTIPTRQVWKFVYVKDAIDYLAKHGITEP